MRCNFLVILLTEHSWASSPLQTKLLSCYRQSDTHACQSHTRPNSPPMTRFVSSHGAAYAFSKCRQNECGFDYDCSCHYTPLHWFVVGVRRILFLWLPFCFGRVTRIVFLSPFVALSLFSLSHFSLTLSLSLALFLSFLWKGMLGQPLPFTARSSNRAFPNASFFPRRSLELGSLPFASRPSPLHPNDQLLTYLNLTFCFWYWKFVANEKTKNETSFSYFFIFFGLVFRL